MAKKDHSKDKTSREERAVAKWMFRRYKDICESIAIHEEGGQGLDHDSEQLTRYKTHDDSDDYIANIQLKAALEYSRDQYLKEEYRGDVWQIAIGNKRFCDYDDYEQGILTAEYNVLLEGFCKEWGIDTTRNIRRWGPMPPETGSEENENK